MERPPLQHQNPLIIISQLKQQTPHALKLYYFANYTIYTQKINIVKYSMTQVLIHFERLQ